MESDGNKLSSYDLVCNAVYTYPVRHKSRFYVEPCKRQETVTVSMSTVYIKKIEVKALTRKIELPQRNFLRFLTQSKNTRQRPFRNYGH